MTDFYEEGFLCTEIEKLSNLCYEENTEWFSLYERTNRYCVQLMPKLKFQNSNLHAALTVALYIRQVALFESVVILSRKCMVREAMILLRTLIENMFILVALTKDAENAELYYNNNYLTKLRGLKSQKEFNPETFHQRGLDKRMQELEEKVRSLKIKRVSIKDWADKAELTDFYNTVYPYLSWTVHSNVLDSATLLKGISDHDVRQVEWHPEPERVGLVLSSAIECSSIGAKAVNQMFKLGQEREIEPFQVENHAIAVKMGLSPNGIFLRDRL